MRLIASIVCLLVIMKANAQAGETFIPVTKPSEAALLSQSLTKKHTKELEKVRAIFEWITDNISYRTRIIPDKTGRLSMTWLDDEDTSSVLEPLNERIARQTLKRREAVCDGYARLFKTLCDHAGINSEIITGYARTNVGRIGEKFRANHTWNAVMIDSTWHLLDVTWASGFVSYSGSTFIKFYDGYYFLTPPKDFVRDHYPEDLRWTLMDNPPTLKEFYHTPFKYMGFIKTRINFYQPSKGIIYANPGDWIQFELETTDKERTLIVSDSSLSETSLSSIANCGYSTSAQKIRYDYQVPENPGSWIYVYYNGEIALRYKLEPAKKSRNQ